MPYGIPGRYAPETLDRIRSGFRFPVPLPMRFAGYASSCGLSQLFLSQVKTAPRLSYYTEPTFIFWGVAYLERAPSPATADGQEEEAGGGTGAPAPHLCIQRISGNIGMPWPVTPT